MKILVQLYLKDLLRNKMLGIMVILVPFIFYPLIYWGINQFLIVKAGFEQNRITTLRYSIKESAYSSLTDSLKAIRNLSVQPYSGENEKNPIILEIDQKYDLPKYIVHIDSSNSAHSRIWPLIESKLRNYYEKEKLSLIHDKGYSPEYFNVFNIQTHNTEGDHEVIIKVLSLLIPLMAVISIIASIAAASVEITSGHTEDRTTETSLTVPQKREVIIMSRFVTVVIYGMLAGAVNFIFLISFILSLFNTFIEKMSNDITGFDWGHIINLKIIAFCFISLLLTSFFVSIILVTASGFASKRKEGSVLVSPFTALLTYLPLVIVIPAVEPNIFIAATPVLNISFTFKLLIEKNHDIAFMLQTALFSCMWIFLVYKFFFPYLLDEEVLLGSSGSSLTKKIKGKWNKWKKR